MTNSLADIRARIHQKSEHYFTFSRNIFPPDSRRMFYGATDALLDASMAAEAYRAAIQTNAAIDLLVCYGFLQAIYIQQDAVLTLARSLGLRWHPNHDNELREIRTLRNRVTGHPALAGETEKEKRLSSAVIEYHAIRETGFSAQIYFSDRVERSTISVQDLLRKNEQRLAIQMLDIERELDARERAFRKEQIMKPLNNHFGTGFDYLVQRLRPEMDSDGRPEQSKEHAGMIREKLLALKADLSDRQLENDVTNYRISMILDGIALLEELVDKYDGTSKGQNQIDIFCDGLSKNIFELKGHMDEIDRKLGSPV